MTLDHALAAMLFIGAGFGASPATAQSACDDVSGYTRTCRLSPSCIVRLSGPGVPSIDVSGCPELAARGLCRRLRR